ncbi:MAG: SWIM zinc finger family protein [Acidobacteria bacterium]|nr:SWIM zinc finger family protein [Acidobacteriota bacterium]
MRIIKQLLEITGNITLERGQHYAFNGRVISLTQSEDIAIIAQVQGSQLYDVRFWLKGKILQYSCTCPFAIEGAFCKHCVAVGIVLVNNSDLKDNKATNKNLGIFAFQR